HERHRIGSCRNVHAHRLEIGDGRGWQPTGKFHGPGDGAGNPVVIIYDEAADPAQGIAEREWRGTELSGEPPRHAPPPAVEQDAEHRAEEAAVPDETAAAEQRIA